MKRSLVSLLLLAALAAADLYMQNPRGSNDRLNEANTNRNNGNRLFDSQNNAKGGYCYGPAMSFYEGSYLTIEWTNQHGCGNPKLYCNLVIQYMCSNTDADNYNVLRDGTTTNTITYDPNNRDTGTTTVDANNKLTFGMHENWEWYKWCDTRSRNMGLWIADRRTEGGLTPGRDDSRFTRQNNNGDRHGYECPEERDYYPYWHPSPWKDIAILTNDETWCDFYKTNSQNVMDKGYCYDTDDTTQTKNEYNNQVSCAANQGTWVLGGSWGIAAPDCVLTEFSNDNHLGNGMTGFMNSYNWTLPTADQEDCIAASNCNCALRLRYNISTGDLGVDGNRPDSGFIDWTSNDGSSPIKDDQTSQQDGLNLTLAMDTTQFGRTFQDRSYVFHIKPRPDGVSNLAHIFNLNVKGKRGNIVETYPATEYDFVPTYLHVKVGDYIHFQWTGCDTNPAGNAGEGTDSTDRSNIVQISSLDVNVPATDDWLAENSKLFEDQALRMRMTYLDQGATCLTYEQLTALGANVDQDVRNCMVLNAAPAYFDGGLIQMNITNNDGFHYMSSRNNNFSNRGQKATIYVHTLLPTWAIAVVSAGGFLFMGSAGVAGAMFYAKSHPHSGVANMFSKF